MWTPAVDLDFHELLPDVPLIQKALFLAMVLAWQFLLEFLIIFYLAFFRLLVLVAFLLRPSGHL